MPQVEHPQHWLKTHPLAVWGSVGLVLLAGGVVAAAMGLGLVGMKKVSPSEPSQKKSKLVVIPVTTPTAEELRTAKNTVRAEGKITSITEANIILTLTGQTKPVTLKLTNTTLYSKGSQGKTADKSSLHPGQMAIVVYDISTDAAASVWGGYNE